MFGPTSRYNAVSVFRVTAADGREIAYIGRRFLPPADRFALLFERRMHQSERVDHVAAEFLGDPEQFWRLCDANGVVDPLELQETGRRVRITLPEGVPAPRNT